MFCDFIKRCLLLTPGCCTLHKSRPGFPRDHITLTWTPVEPSKSQQNREKWWSKTAKKKGCKTWKTIKHGSKAAIPQNIRHWRILEPCCNHVFYTRLTFLNQTNQGAWSPVCKPSPGFLTLQLFATFCIHVQGAQICDRTARCSCDPLDHVEAKGAPQKRVVQSSRRRNLTWHVWHDISQPDKLNVT